jgi:hypothetical protein
MIPGARKVAAACLLPALIVFSVAAAAVGVLAGFALGVTSAGGAVIVGTVVAVVILGFLAIQRAKSFVQEEWDPSERTWKVEWVDLLIWIHERFYGPPARRASDPEVHRRMGLVLPVVLLVGVVAACVVSYWLLRGVGPWLSAHWSALSGPLTGCGVPLIAGLAIFLFLAWYWFLRE